MTSSAEPKKYAVIGGGIFGTATAWQLARAGANVTLLTDATLSSGASGRSLSWLNSFGDNPAEYHELRMVGLERYRAWRSDVESSGRYLRFDGGAHVLSEAAIAPKMRMLADRHYPIRLLSPVELTHEAPGVRSAAIPGFGALFAPGEGWVDLPSLIVELADRCQAAGGTVVTHAGPARVDVVKDRVVAVQGADGSRWVADAVLVATGAEVPRMASVAGVTLAAATPLAVCLQTAPVRSALRAVVNTPAIALRPGMGGRLVIDHDWASASIGADANGTLTIPDATRSELLEQASFMLEGRPRLDVASIGIGPKPMPADNLPVLGELPTVRGYYVAFSHSGATLGLIAGELLAREMMTGVEEPLLAPFSPRHRNVQTV